MRKSSNDLLVELQLDTNSRNIFARNAMRHFTFNNTAKPWRRSQKDFTKEKTSILLFNCHGAKVTTKTVKKLFIVVPGWITASN